jgi:hypothetical protein
MVSALSDKRQRGLSTASVLGLTVMMTVVGAALIQQSGAARKLRQVFDVNSRIEQRHKTALTQLSTLINGGALWFNAGPSKVLSAETAALAAIGCENTGAGWSIPAGKRWCFMPHNRAAPTDGKAHALVAVCENRLASDTETSSLPCRSDQISAEVDITLDSYKTKSGSTWGPISNPLAADPANSYWANVTASSIKNMKIVTTTADLFVGSTVANYKLDKTVNDTDLCFFMRMAPSATNNEAVNYNADGTLTLLQTNLAPRLEGKAAGEYGGEFKVKAATTTLTNNYQVMEPLQKKVLALADNEGRRGFQVTVTNNSKDATLFMGVQPNQGPNGPQFQYYLADNVYPGEGYSHKARCTSGDVIKKINKTKGKPSWHPDNAYITQCEQTFNPNYLTRDISGHSRYSAACLHTTTRDADFCARVDMPWGTAASTLQKKCVAHTNSGYGSQMTSYDVIKYTGSLNWSSLSAKIDTCASKAGTLTTLLSGRALSSAAVASALSNYNMERSASTVGFTTGQLLAQEAKISKALESLVIAQESLVQSLNLTKVLLVGTYYAPIMLNQFLTAAPPSVLDFNAFSAVFTSPEALQALNSLKVALGIVPNLPTPTPTPTPTATPSITDNILLLQQLLIAKLEQTNACGFATNGSIKYKEYKELPSSLSASTTPVAIPITDQVVCQPSWPDTVANIREAIEWQSGFHPNGAPKNELNIPELGAVLDLDSAGLSALYLRIPAAKAIVESAIQDTVNSLRDNEMGSSNFTWDKSSETVVISGDALRAGYVYYEKIDATKVLDDYEATRCVYMRYHDIMKPKGCYITMAASDDFQWACRNSDGCFAKGTLIRMADGTEREISSLRRGDLVWNPITNRAAAVKRMTVGPEIKPMLRVTVNGKTVDVTDGHPFMTSAGWKKTLELRVGDLVVSASGDLQPVDALVALPVGNEPPDVFNFALEGDGADDHFVLANGVVTGDLFMQESIGKRK